MRRHCPVRCCRIAMPIMRSCHWIRSESNCVANSATFAGSIRFLSFQKWIQLPKLCMNRRSDSNARALALSHFSSFPSTTCWGLEGQRRVYLFDSSRNSLFSSVVGSCSIIIMITQRARVYSNVENVHRRAPRLCLCINQTVEVPQKKVNIIASYFFVSFIFVAACGRDGGHVQCFCLVSARKQLKHMRCVCE